jgi:hypothetical protein
VATSVLRRRIGAGGMRDRALPSRKIDSGGEGEPILVREDCSFMVQHPARGFAVPVNRVSIPGRHRVPPL